MLQGEIIMINKESDINRKTLLAYSGLALPLTLIELPLGMYLPAFYAKEMGISLAAIGIIFTVARLWDGFSDLLIGRLSDQLTSPYGRRKPWVLLGGPLLILSAWCLFNPTGNIDTSYLVLWLVLFYTVLTIVKIPYWTWGAELGCTVRN